jgi:hypothetical protein
MASTLLEIWKDQPSFVEAKAFRQIIQLAGDGRLRDGSGTSKELRDWLAAIPRERLKGCVEECLAESFEDGPLALQDVANEIGSRLGFVVSAGRYRGQKGHVGNDGLWRAEDGFTLLVEVKTTDTYRINLDIVVGYRKELTRAGAIEANRSSILIAVGRQDTGDLEAQIRGSRHAWDIRLISLEALLRLAEVKEELSDWDTSKKINQLLRPVEYTRLDGIVELLFAAKKDLESPASVEPPADAKLSRAIEPLSTIDLERARELAVSRISRKVGCTFVRRGRASRLSSDGSRRLVCLASQRYEGSGGTGTYWYGFTPAQRHFLSEGGIGWVSFVFADSGRVLLIEWEQFSKWLFDLWTTPPEPSTDAEIRHWHVYINDSVIKTELMRSGGGLLVDLTRFFVPSL